jgi:hypothetical protein
MTEAELLEHIKAACRWLRVLAYHTRDSRGSDPGFPDLVLAGPGGFAIWELKSETGRLTPAQGIWIRQLRDAGVDVEIRRPNQWPEVIMRELRALARREH